MIVGDNQCLVLGESIREGGYLLFFKLVKGYRDLDSESRTEKYTNTIAAVGQWDYWDNICML